MTHSTDLEEKIAREFVVLEIVQTEIAGRLIAQAALSVIREWFELVEKKDHNPSRDHAPATCAAPLASEQAGQYRKRPVVIEAYEFHNRVGPDTRPQWLIDAAEAGTVEFHQLRTGLPWLVIHTLEGSMRANHGDWIIQGVQGEIYPCKPDIFEATYEPATAPNPQDEINGRGGQGSSVANECADGSLPVLTETHISTGKEG